MASGTFSCRERIQFRTESSLSLSKVMNQQGGTFFFSFQYNVFFHPKGSELFLSHRLLINIKLIHCRTGWEDFDTADKCI